MAHSIVSMAVGWRAWIAPGGELFGLLLLVAALALGVSIMLALSWRSRRRLARDCRQMTGLIEDLRQGRIKREVKIESSSPLAAVADALGRMRHDVDARREESARTAEQMQAVMDAVRGNAVISTDTDGDIRSFSTGAVDLFGWEEKEVLARPASLLFDEDSYKEFLPKLARKSLREQGVESSATLKKRDGRTFSAELSVRMLRNAAKEAIGFLIVVKDVTERTELERELRASEQRYRTLVENLAEGVLIVREGVVLYANPAFARLCGAGEGELEGTLLRDRISTVEMLVVEEKLRELEKKPGENILLHCRLLDPDSSVQAHVALQGAAVEYEKGTAVLLVARDETVRRTMEIELRRNESQLDAVIESATDGILMLVEGKDGGMVQMANRAFEDLFALPCKEILGISLGRLVMLLGERGAGGREVAALLAGSGERGRRQMTVLEGPRPREVEVSVAPLRDKRGELLGRVLVCHDLTVQRESERQLQRHAEQLQLRKLELEKAYSQLDGVNEDLKARTEELNALNQELRTLDEMKSNLLGNVSHELQTPLVSIRGYTEMILRDRLGPINEEQRKGLNLCLKNIDRLIAMIDNLLAFTRSQPGMGRLSLSRFALQNLVAEAAELLKDKMKERAIRFSVTLEPPDLAVNADRDKILQVFINLLSNAVKFNRHEGEVSVTARHGKPGFVNINISDTGIGIPAEARARIFERHYRVDEGGAPNEEGSGIGLAIVRDILRLHGCRIDVQSEEHRGSIFSFTLPLSAERAEEILTGAPAVETVAAPEEAEKEVEIDEDEAEEARQDPDGPKPRFRVIRRRDPR
jgi:PAS domain S-box-containing protein